MDKTIREIFKANNLKCDKIVKSEAGFTSLVYFVDDTYVIKLASQTTGLKLKKEILFYKNVKEDFLPQYVSSGEEPVAYLIIKKIGGKSLYNIWHIISESDRENIIKEMCNILKKINSYSGDFLPQKYRCSSWKDKWLKAFEYNAKLLKEKKIDTFFMEDFAKTKLCDIINEQKICLVYNDAHFDNFIFDGKKLYIIDFDRVIEGSSDYELLILDSMLDNPLKFASEEEEKFVNVDHYKNVRSYIKKYYSELYSYNHFEDRLFIYKFFYRLSAGFEYNHDEWLNKEIILFKEHFGYKQ